jgi:hypothetical protein
MSKIASLLTLLLIPFFQEVSAQTNTNSQSSKLPSWVAMIDDPNTNYYEAIRAFDLYWSNKIKPKGDTQMMREMESGIKTNSNLEDSLGRMSVAEKAEYELIRYHYKRFKDWRFEVKPFVQEDGRILSMNERIQIWNKQQEEIKQQNK